MENINIRSGLINTENALKRKSISIGFLGGSITENRVPHNWTEPFISYLMRNNNGLKLISENAAIGATGSDLGLMRVERDIIKKGCDLVFIEYAVNDFWTATKERCGAMEGIIRRLKKQCQCDIIFVYTFNQDMYSDIASGKVPSIIQEYDKIADYYLINSAWVGRYAFERVKCGEIKWEEWLPDGLHPQYRGSYEYANCIIKLFETAKNFNAKNVLANEKQLANEKVKALPTPLSANNWESAELLPLSKLDFDGSFYIKRCATQSYADYMLYSCAIGDSVAIQFEGRSVILVFDFGKSSCEFSYCVDGGEEKVSERDRPVWVGKKGWLRPFRIDANSFGRHSVSLKIVHGNKANCTGTNFDLAFVLVLQ